MILLSCSGCEPVRNRNNYLFCVLDVLWDVKVLLKDPGTKLFLKDSNRWTNNFADAMDFKTTPAAMDYSLIHGFQEISIVLKFVNTRYDLELNKCC